MLTCERRWGGLHAFGPVPRRAAERRRPSVDEEHAIDRRLEAEMTGYWLAFAATGDPNGADRPSWPTLQEDPLGVLELGDETGWVPRPRPDEVDFWLARG